MVDDEGTEAETQLVVSHSWIDGNGFWVPGTGLGGGLYAAASARVVMMNSTVSDNVALDGAGMWVNERLFLKNSTVTGNDASGTGGGLYLDVPPGESGLVSAQFATIAENDAGVSGGGIACPEDGEDDPSSVCFSVGATILASNQANGAPSDCTGRGGAGMDVLVGQAEGCISVVVTAGTFIEGEDPMLQPLAFSGGWTPTMALEPGSPAEDVIQEEPNEPLDQRGFLRPGRPDLGAYEIAGIELASGERPEPATALALDPPAPNPVADRVSISFTQPTSGAARLVLHDMLGREVRVMHDGMAPAEHEVTLDVRGLAPGLYVLRLTSAGQQATRKLSVVR